MSPLVIAVIGLSVLVLLILLRMPIGIAMAVPGLIGLLLLYSQGAGFAHAWNVVLSRLAAATWSTAAVYELTVVPLFIWMGFLAGEAGLGSDFFRAAYVWLARARGGLAIATTAASTAFGAVCGDAVAGGVTMASIALPEMRKACYDDRLSLGTLALGGTLSFMIPPSLCFIVFAFLMNQPVSLLFGGGLIPGLLIALISVITIFIWARIEPAIAKKPPQISWRERLTSLKFAWTIPMVFVIVIVGMYTGILTSIEAAAAGVITVLLMGLCLKRFTWQKISRSIFESTILTGMLYLLLFGSSIFKDFLTISEAPMVLVNWVNNLGWPPFAVLAVIVLVHFILGMFLPMLGIMVVTVPLLLPVVLAMGIHPILFAVLMTLAVMIGGMTPPVGLVVYAICGYAKVPLQLGFQGVTPFIVAALVAMILLVAFPELSLFIPKLMSSAFFQ